MMNRIDVIIPIKGRSEMLFRRSLPSLLTQTFQGFKVTIVDDGSTEEDFQKIETAAKEFRQKGLLIDVIQNQGVPGAAGARNFGFRSTSADYVLWFDSDDILLENKLEVSLNLIELDHYDLAITRAQHIVNSKLIDEFWGEPVAPNRGTYEFHFPYQTMCALYRRAFLNQSEIRWNERNNYMDDWEMSNEVLLKTDNWVFSPAVTAHYYAPTTDSGSIGSVLTRRKIKSQKNALRKIREIRLNRSIKNSKVASIKLFAQQLYFFKQQFLVRR